MMPRARIGMVVLVALGACSERSAAPAPDSPDAQDDVRIAVMDAPNEVAPEADASEGAAPPIDAEPDGEAKCGPASVTGIVSGPGIGPGKWDPLGYPPYALDGCTLVYVTPVDGARGELRVRDLATGVEELLAPSADAPSRPAVSGSTIAWEVTVAGKSQVRVRQTGTVRTIEGPFDHAGEPRAARGAVVFTAWLGPNDTDDTDVFVYDAEAKTATPLATGRGQQRFADISDTHVAITDFAEDPNGRFDEMMSIADISVFERATGRRIDRSLPGKQAFPMLGTNGRVGYLEWRLIHPEPKFSEFFIKSGLIDGSPDVDRNIKGADVVKTDPAYVRPSVHGSEVDFIDTTSGSPQLFRATLDDASAPALVRDAPAGSLVGPVAAASMTLVGVSSGGSFLLRGVAR
jgi:hypothetical protein